MGDLVFDFVDSIEHVITLAKAIAGEKCVTLLGASIDQQSLSAGLVDKILIHHAPILISRGIRLFDKLRTEDIELERIGLAATSGIIS